MAVRRCRHSKASKIMKEYEVKLMRLAAGVMGCRGTRSGDYQCWWRREEQTFSFVALSMVGGGCNRVFVPMPSYYNIPVVDKSLVRKLN